jgi:hypothetical protein
MSDDSIKDAFLKGIAASEQADALFAEATRVIRDASAKVRDASGGELSLVLDETWIEKTNRLMTQAVATLMGPLVPERKKTHAIFAVRSGTDANANICIVKFSRDTFPVELQWETEAVLCRDANELESALPSLLADPRTGKKMRELLAKKAAPKPLPAPGASGSDPE